MPSPISALASGLVPPAVAGTPAASGPRRAAFADTLGAVLADTATLQPGTAASGRLADGTRLGGVAPVPSPFAVDGSVIGGPRGAGFGHGLSAALAEVQQAQQAAADAARAYATGRSTDVTSTLIAVERASVTFQLMVQLRNRLLEAYQELQRLQV